MPYILILVFSFYTASSRIFFLFIMRAALCCRFELIFIVLILHHSVPSSGFTTTGLRCVALLSLVTLAHCLRSIPFCATSFVSNISTTIHDYIYIRSGSRRRRRRECVNLSCAIFFLFSPRVYACVVCT